MNSTRISPVKVMLAIIILLVAFVAFKPAPAYHFDNGVRYDNAPVNVRAQAFEDSEGEFGDYEHYSQSKVYTQQDMDIAVKQAARAYQVEIDDNYVFLYDGERVVKVFGYNTSIGRALIKDNE